jgi:hypothetical protein
MCWILLQAALLDTVMDVVGFHSVRPKCMDANPACHHLILGSLLSAKLRPRIAEIAIHNAINDAITMVVAGVE